MYSTPSTLNHVFYNSESHPRCEKLLSFRAKDTQVAYSTDQFRAAVEQLSFYFRKQGLRPGDRVAVLSENRPEWHIADFAILVSGLISVPIYTTFSAPQIRYLLDDSEASLLIVSGRELLSKVAAELENLPWLRAIVSFEPAGRVGSLPVTPLSQITADGGLDPRFPAQLKTEALAVDPSSIATIVYTSGTTGVPKGVMLSHGNIASNLTASLTRLEDVSASSALSVLPLAHVFERLLCYGYFYRSIPIAYGDAHDLAELMPLHRPMVLGCVPRILEKIRENVFAEIRKQPVRRQRIANFLLRSAHHHIGEGVLGREPTPFSRMIYPAADALLFSKLKHKLGGNLKFVVCGGGALSREVEEFFLAAGIHVLQGYGLTETAPVLTLSPFSAVKPGTVGKPLDNIQVKVADDGELLVKGPNVMAGYYRDPDGTKAAYCDGWFCTGDLGGIDNDGYLIINGRKKELIVTSGGKNIHPGPIEEQLCRSPLVQKVFVVGDGRKFVAALIVPEVQNLKRVAHEMGLSCDDYQEICAHVRIRELYFAEIKKLQHASASHERVKNFEFIGEEVLSDPDVITPTQKVRRQVLEQKYARVISMLYESAAAKASNGR